jgi:hypothetical protein
MNLLFKDLFQDAWHWSMTQSGMVTGIIVISISLTALWFTEETFNKDLDYFETI